MKQKYKQKKMAPTVIGFKVGRNLEKNVNM